MSDGRLAICSMNRKTMKKMSSEIEGVFNKLLKRAIENSSGNLIFKLGDVELDLSWCLAYSLYSIIMDSSVYHINNGRVVSDLIKQIPFDDKKDEEWIVSLMSKLDIFNDLMDSTDIPSILECSEIRGEYNKFDSVGSLAVALLYVGAVKSNNKLSGDYLIEYAFKSAMDWVLSRFASLPSNGVVKLRDNELTNLGELSMLLLTCWVLRECGDAKSTVRSKRLGQIFNFDQEELLNMALDDDIRYGAKICFGVDVEDRDTKISDWVYREDTSLMVSTAYETLANADCNYIEYTIRPVIQNILKCKIADEAVAKEREATEKEIECLNNKYSEMKSKVRELNSTIKKSNKTEKELTGKLKMAELQIVRKDKEMAKLREELQNNSELNRLNRELESLKNELAMLKGSSIRQVEKIEQLNIELDEKGQYIELLENDNEHIIDINSMLEKIVADYEDVDDDIDMGVVLNKICSKRIAMLGGPKGLGDRVKAYLPNTSVVMDADDKITNIVIPDGCEYVVIYYKCIGHKYSIKAEEIARRKGMETIYIENTNIEKICKKIYKSIERYEAAKKC